MINAYPIEEVIRGHLGTIKFVKGGFQFIKDDPSSSAGIPARLEKSVEPDETVMAGIEGYTKDEWGNNFDTAALWGHFLDCVRSGKRDTLSTPDLGAAAFTTVAMGVQSYREGKVLFWDKNERKVVEADPSWASRLEKRSKERGKPNQIAGTRAGRKGAA